MFRATRGVFGLIAFVVYNLGKRHQQIIQNSYRLYFSGGLRVILLDRNIKSCAPQFAPNQLHHLRNMGRFALKVWYIVILECGTSDRIPWDKIPSRQIPLLHSSSPLLF